jgi:VCBS repeat-containing protein
MMAFLSYGATSISGTGTLNGNNPPVAADDGYDSVKGATLNVPSASGVLLNDSDPDVGQTVKAVAASGATSGLGSYTLNANGSFTYTPAAGFSGADTFSYQATDGKALSAPATVTIHVGMPVEPALGTALDGFNAGAAITLGSNWKQASNGSVDLQVVGGQAKAVTTTLGGQAIWNAASFGPVQAASFSSASSLANSGLILKATGGTLAEAPANYIRVRYESGNGGEVVVSTMLGGSGVSTYIKQGSFPAASSSGTLTASADAKGLVTVWLNSVLLGGVQLPDATAWKGSGRIGIQLQTVGATVDDFKGGSL